MQVAIYLGDTSPPLGDGGFTSPQQPNNLIIIVGIA